MIANKRIKYERDSFDRYGDDILGLLLNFLQPADKLRYECVSKQWQRCIHDSESRIALTLDRKSTSRYPILQCLRRKFKYIRSVEAHMTTGIRSTMSFISTCKYLEEIVLYGYGANTAMWLSFIFSKMLPKNVKQIRFMEELWMDNLYIFNCFIENYGESATQLNLKFGHTNHNYLHINECVNHLKAFKLLRFLKLCSPITAKHINYIGEHLLYLKKIELSDVNNLQVNTIFNSLKKFRNLEIFIIFCGEEHVPVNASHFCKFKSIRNSVIKIAKEGYTETLVNNMNRNCFIYLPKFHYIQAIINQPIKDVFKNEVFKGIKQMVINMSGPISSDVIDLLKINSSIQNLILPELDLTQNIYDIFNEKSLNNTSTNYSIGIISSIKPYKQIIRNNFIVFNNYKMVLFDKLHSFL